MDELAVRSPDKEKKLQRKSNDFLQKCNDFEIASQDEYVRGAEARANGKEFIKEVEEFLDPHIKRAHEAHKALTTGKKVLIQPAEQGRKLLGAKMEKWDADIREKAKQEESRLREEAEEKAKKEESKRLREEAKELKREGDTAGADALREEAKNPIIEAPVVNIDVVPSTPKVSGTHYREYWDVEMISKKDVPLEYMTVNMTMVKDVVSKTKGKVVPPGFRVTKRRRAI